MKKYGDMWALAVLLVLIASNALAGEPPDRSRQYPARTLGLAGLGRSFASGANSVFLNPAALGATSQYQLGAGYTYAGGGADGEATHALSLAWTDSTPNPFHLAMGVVYDYMMYEEGSEQNVHGAASYSLNLGSVTLALGVGAHYFGGPEEAEDITSGDAGLVMNLAQALYLGVAGYNLVSNTDDTYRGVGGGLSFWGGPFMIGADVQADFDVPVATSSDTVSTETVVKWYGGLQLQMIPEAGFRAGLQYDASHEVFRLAGGLQFVVAQAFGMEFGYMQNVEDGDDMYLSVSIDLYNPFGGAGM